MNKSLGEKIDASNVHPGMRVWVRTRTLGSAYVEILEDLAGLGWRVQVVDGTLMSPVSKDRRWRPGKTLTLPVSSVDRFYTLNEAERC